MEEEKGPAWRRESARARRRGLPSHRPSGAGQTVAFVICLARGCKEHRHHRRACLSTKVVYEEEARRRRSPPQAPPEGPRREEPKPLGSINDDCTCK